MIIIIAIILFVGTLIFFVNSLVAISYTFSEDPKRLMNQYVLTITGIITFISIMLFGVFLMVSISYQDKLDKVKPEYEIIQEPVYRKIN